MTYHCSCRVLRVSTFILPASVRSVHYRFACIRPQLTSWDDGTEHTTCDAQASGLKPLLYHSTVSPFGIYCLLLATNTSLAGSLKSHAKHLQNTHQKPKLNDPRPNSADLCSHTSANQECLRDSSAYPAQSAYGIRFITLRPAEKTYHP